MTIFDSLLTTFEAIISFWGSWGDSKIWFEPKPNHYNKVKASKAFPNLWSNCMTIISCVSGSLNFSSSQFLLLSCPKPNHYNKVKASKAFPNPWSNCMTIISCVSESLNFSSSQFLLLSCLPQKIQLYLNTCQKWPENNHLTYFTMIKPYPTPYDIWFYLFLFIYYKLNLAMVVWS